MRWHRVEERGGGEELKPSLEAVMEHVGVQFNSMRNAGMAQCPLHDDRTPSFSYKLDEGLWNCHSCSNGGDSFTLIQKYLAEVEHKEVGFAGLKDYARDNGLYEGATTVSKDDGYRSRYGGGHRTADKKAGRKTGGSYVPAWRRK
ncbi:CHC2 zinc finger domain-containing protein [Streptomyces sp. NPDC002547]